ncbi:hypothetical protein QOZ80_8BG0662250 [Eleusine coracana subsp. coracana]|nr:hypothetical protein QOZ80_8BG0662250 [Eleusine coracana subsp. coracana]
MPMKESARAACVSRIFFQSWRHYPSLILTKKTLGFKQNTCAKGDIEALTYKVDQILKNHSGAAVKTLELDIFHCRDLDPCLLNNWLRISITPGTENVTLSLPKRYKEEYTFPCSRLFGGSGNSSIEYLHLTNCALRPTDHLGCLRSLTELYLREVCITGEELECLLSNSHALTELELVLCNEIICLKVPCVLERLSCLVVSDCSMLQMIESKAPNLSSINLEGDLVQLSLGQSLQVKSLDMDCSTGSNFLSYAITKLPYIVPNVETPTLSSISEV